MEESYAEVTCGVCNAKLSLLKKDVKRGIIHKKGEDCNYTCSKVIKKYEDTDRLEDLELKIIYKVYRKFSKNIYNKYYNCVVCDLRNILYEESEPEYSESKRELSGYQISGYIPYSIRLDMRGFPKINLSKDQFDEMLTWKPNKLRKYLLSNNEDWL